MTTPLDEIKKYKNRIINLICNSKDILGLLSDTPDIDIDSQQAANICHNNIFDYSYILDTQLQEGAFIFVEIEIPKRFTKTCKQVDIYVEIVCHKNYINLSNKYKLIGNRKDNIACYLSNLIEGNQNLGIGRPLLQALRGFNVPAPYTGCLLKFSTDSFILKEDEK